MPASRVLHRLLAAAVAAATLAVPSAASAGPEWRSMTGGVGWRPCQTVTLSPNPVGGPPTFLAELGEAVDRVNAAAGVPVLAVGGLTTTTRDLDDTTSAVYFEDLPGSVAGTAWIRWTTSGGTPVEIVRGDIGLDAPAFLGMSANQRVAVMIHEIGHFLGLAHVGDAHEALSNGFVYDGDVGVGTAEALRRLYASGCTVGTRIGDGPDGHAWALPSPDGYNGSLASVSRWDLARGAGSVIDLGVELVGASTARRGRGWARTAVVCRDDVFADCLGGAALAGVDGPLLFVPGGPGGTLPDHVRANLQAALPSDGTVYVLGGDLAVSPQVAAALRAVWPDTRRLSGPSRVETAVAVAVETVARRGRQGVALLARDDNPADAVTAGAAAGARGLPVLLTAQGSLHPATAQALATLGVGRTLLLGGTAALAPDVESALAAQGRGPERVAGRTRSETSVAVARHAALWGRTHLPAQAAFVGLNGYHAETWALALATAPLAAHMEAPILLTSDRDVAISAAAGGYPGEPGWYLSHLTVGDGVGQVALTYVYVGVGRWADRHAAESFRSYVFLGR